MHALRLGVPVVFIATMATMLVGHAQAQLMVQQQPMKMAAAEALYDTKASAPFSLFTVGTLDGSKAVFQIGIPSVLSFMSTGDFNGTVEGINDLQKSYEEKYGAGDYTPNVPLAYWSFRLMIGFGFLGLLFVLLAMWGLRRGATPKGKWFAPAMYSLPFIPLLSISFGWIFTETARQPWAVFGLIKTADGVSAVVSAGAVLFTMIVFTLLYGVLAFIEIGLTLKVIKNGPAEEFDYEDPQLGGSEDKQLVMAY